MGGLWQELQFYIDKIEWIFKSEGIAIPIGFTKEDVFLDAPNLYDNGFDIMLVRILKEVSMGMYTINMNMAYRDDVMGIYEGLTSVTHRIYKQCTLYLLKKGILTTPPKSPIPKSNSFVESKNYLSGFKLFSDKRDLNDIELGIIHHGIESNNIGMQLISGFAQCAKNKEVARYFLKGKDLAKKQMRIFEELLLENDIPFTITSGGTVNASKVPPFSDKLMMFCVFLLNGFGIVGASFGTIFSLRKDLSLKNTLIGKDIYFYATEGIKLMIKNKWLEEAPHMDGQPK